MRKTPGRSFRSKLQFKRRTNDGARGAAGVHHRCSVCGFTMSPIRLVAESGDGRQGEVSYVRLETESAPYMNRFPVDGRVRGRICRACGRIELFGELAD